MSEPNLARQTKPNDAADGVEPRSMSLAEIRDAVADHVDQMDGSSFVNRLLTARYRRRLFADADGRVLDVACGTGTNLQYLPESVDYCGIDLSPEMLDRAQKRFDRLERGETLLEVDAQNLEFDDDSFDTVISSMSTCMFPEPVPALNEMNRVCKPDGRILLLEHGRSSNGLVARVQDWRADERYRKMGCRWNQEPLAVVSPSELEVLDATTGTLGTITAIEARPRYGELSRPRI
jgi:ubiquinone/menaquinone biosynthesis C-methylase UbiE